MKRFIQLTISFLLIFIVLISVFVGVTECLIKRNSDFKLSINPKYLVLGHSHPECAFNDSLIDNLTNLSQSGESYYYTYFKVKKLIEQNPYIEVLFIEFTNNQINESMNDRIWGKEYMNHRYPKYAPFIHNSDKMVLIENNFYGYFNAMSLSLKNNFERIVQQNYSYTKDIGGYLYLERNNTDSLVKNVSNNFPDSKDVMISAYNLKYLSEIIRFCEEKGKEVILIRSPQHEKYAGYANELIYQQIRDSLYSSIEYLDFSRFPLNNSEFGDLQHLNYKGAKVFSKWFNQLLDKGLLEKSDKQDYIDEELKARVLNNL